MNKCMNLVVGRVADMSHCVAFVGIVKVTELDTANDVTIFAE